MNHFKEFLIKLQTLDIQIFPKKAVTGSEKPEIFFYDISHENPYLNASYKNEFKELKELAITDILNLSREQISFQLRRLGDIRELFKRFWQKYYHLKVLSGSDQATNFIYNLSLNEDFIAPKLYYPDHAIANDNFINDLEDTIRARENILEEFEEAVSKIIEFTEKAEKNTFKEQTQEATKAKPVFKEGVAEEFFSIIKEFFSESDQPLLLKIITSKGKLSKPILFNGPDNQLADAFKQLLLSNLIRGCNKAELENWIQINFQYRDKGIQKPYTEKYLQDIISSNTKFCQSPLFDVKKLDG